MIATLDFAIFQIMIIPLVYMYVHLVNMLICTCTSVHVHVCFNVTQYAAFYFMTDRLSARILSVLGNYLVDHKI